MSFRTRPVNKCPSQPRVGVSRCLGFEPGRHDGSILCERLITLLEPHGDFLDVCSEAEIGLGKPRLD